jgi:hypothetical protein
MKTRKDPLGSGQSVEKFASLPRFVDQQLDAFVLNILLGFFLHFHHPHVPGSYDKNFWRELLDRIFDI